MDVLQVNDKEFSVTLTMYFSVQWEEPRIVTNNTVEEGEWTPIDLQFLNNLWVPNIFIYDLRSFSAMSVLKKLAGVWIVEGKAIYYNQVGSIFGAWMDDVFRCWGAGVSREFVLQSTSMTDFSLYSSFVILLGILSASVVLA